MICIPSLINAQLKVRSSQRSKISIDLCLLFCFQLIPHPPKKILLTFYSPFNPDIYIRNYWTNEHFICISHQEEKGIFTKCTSKGQDKTAICHFVLLSITNIKHCMLKQKHTYHNLWKYLPIQMCSKSLYTLQCSFLCICNWKKNPLTFTDSSSTKHLRKYFSSDAFIHRIKNMQIFKPSSISPIPHWLAGKFQSSDGNFTVYYFLLEVCYTNITLKPIPIIFQPTSEFHCGMSTLSKILQLILLCLEEWLAEIWTLWKIIWL